ncbi:deacetylase [Pokkaliibacter plantistimulans]|uniref:Deacetylase n=1 Tax=Proteobacteria bacterium 228 TaxID=2083153 RepID=A0A2S5KKK5_9PROT|nr:histone deacetylase family protein [Pokkaliibacter plantistimulans]PPC74866.1 deacetylase [Pokkaliibacter plantistimulans]
MSTAFISHTDCELHDLGPDHPESPIRLKAIMHQLNRSGLLGELQTHNAVHVLPEQILLAHTPLHVRRLELKLPQEGVIWTDDDTALCPKSLHAASLAAGASILATNRVLSGKNRNAFCAIRPPGHHAEHNLAMGFCFYNNIAIAALHALQHEAINRVAIFDFDVHQGNGTVDIFKDNPAVLFCSTFQHPFYPGRYNDLERPNIINCPLPAFADGEAFRRAFSERCLPALEAHAPDMIFISAGFDAHWNDPMADMRLNEEDYLWITRQLMTLADRYSKGRIVSILEGGYNPTALAYSVQAHLEGLLGG